jgi:hypothetical protein
MRIKAGCSPASIPCSMLACHHCPILSAAPLETHRQGSLSESMKLPVLARSKPALYGTDKMWEGWVVAPFLGAFVQPKPPLAREPLQVKLTSCPGLSRQCLVGRQPSGHCNGPRIALEKCKVGKSWGEMSDLPCLSCRPPARYCGLPSSQGSLCTASLHRVCLFGFFPRAAMKWNQPFRK